MVMRTENYDELIEDSLDHCPLEGRTHFIALALAGEAGEHANKAKKVWRSQGLDADPDGAIALGELVDIYNYVHMEAQHYGITCKELHVRAREKLLEVKSRPDYEQYGKKS
jgi:hypothetical protein